MSSGDKDLSFFISVEGQAYSNHRSPQGVYKIGVQAERTIAHSAFAAIQVAKDSVPFLDENLDYFTIRAFLEDGREVVVPRPMVTAHEQRGFYCGRAKDYPDTIELQ